MFLGNCWPSQTFSKSGSFSVLFRCLLHVERPTPTKIINATSDATEIPAAAAGDSEILLSGLTLEVVPFPEGTLD